jgi:SH3 domain-containing YSC84-like protein 1
MRKFSLAVSFCACAALVQAAETAQERLAAATEVFHDIMATPDKGIPQDLLEKSNCIVIVPGLKQGAFVIGAKFGRGYAMCRHATAGWSAPAAVRVEGGSVGFQIGGSEIDVVMLVMNQTGMNKLMQDKFTLGAEATIAAGPVGRTSAAQTDAKMNAEILSWSRSRGLFAGIALNGATLRPDKDMNEELYGSKLVTKDIVMSDRKPPAQASALIADLNRFSTAPKGEASRERK